jgi:hypothetical protein
MKTVTMPLNEYEADLQDSTQRGVTIGLYCIVQHLKGIKDFSESGYDTENNRRYLTEIESLIKGT